MSLYRLLYLHLSACLLVATGCTVESSCDLMAMTSVQLHVQDQTGMAVQGVQVRYRLNENPAFIACLQDGQDWSCGFAASGTFHIEVSAPFFATQFHEVVVSDGECHVVSQQLEVILEQDDCALIEQERAIHLSLVDSSGKPISAHNGAWASWGDPLADMTPIPCEVDGFGNFYCGDFEPGSYEIAAGAIGHHRLLEVIEVAAHYCGDAQVERVERVLQDSATACTENLAASVNLRLLDQQGNPSSSATTPQYRSLYRSDSSLQDCDVVSAGEWICGWELAGAIEVILSADDLDQWSTTVFVPSDDCHVISQNLTVSL